MYATIGANFTRETHNTHGWMDARANDLNHNFKIRQISQMIINTLSKPNII